MVFEFLTLWLLEACVLCDLVQAVGRAAHYRVYFTSTGYRSCYALPVAFMLRRLNGRAEPDLFESIISEIDIMAIFTRQSHAQTKNSTRQAQLCFFLIPSQL